MLYQTSGVPRSSPQSPNTEKQTERVPNTSFQEMIHSLGAWTPKDLTIQRPKNCQCNDVHLKHVILQLYSERETTILVMGLCGSFRKQGAPTMEQKQYCRIRHIRTGNWDPHFGHTVVEWIRLSYGQAWRSRDEETQARLKRSKRRLD